MTYTVCSARQWLYTDSAVEKKEYSRSLLLARNGSDEFQILINGAEVGAPVSAELTGAVSDGALFALEGYRERSAKVEHNTGVHGFTADWETAKDYATRPAPFRVFDALEPLRGGLLTENETEAFYFVLRAFDAKPGRYALALSFTVGQSAFSVPLEVEVTAAVIPDETLKVTNWFSVGSMASSHGLEMWSDEHWAMVERYARAMRRCHQNVFWVTWDLVESRWEDGGYRFDFTNAGKLIDICLSLGFTTIEGSPIWGRDGWDAVNFKINTPKGRLDAMSEEGFDYAAALLDAWYDFLVENDWYDLLIQHVGDEPHARCGGEYRILAGIVRKHLPGVPLIDAVETHELYGALDIWVPKNDYYDRNEAAMEKKRAQGDEVWFYTCCIPGGHYCNRLLDMPLLRSRMLHWGNYVCDLPGFLHWGFNHWRGSDPFEETTPMNGPTNRLPAGDTNIVYPLGKDVLLSMRLEQERCGCEEYELLKALAAADADRADAIAAKVFRSFKDCDNAPEDFDAARAELLRAF